MRPVWGRESGAVKGLQDLAWGLRPGASEVLGIVTEEPEPTISKIAVVRDQGQIPLAAVVHDQGVVEVRLIVPEALDEIPHGGCVAPKVDVGACWRMLVVAEAQN